MKGANSWVPLANPTWWEKGRRLSEKSTCPCSLAKSCPTLLQTPWMAAHQAPLSMEFPRQEYWSGLLFPSPVELPNTGIETESPASPALAGQSYFSRGSVVPAEGTQKRKRSPPKKGRLIKSVFWVVLRAHPLDVKSTIVTSHGGPPHPLRRAPWDAPCLVVT